MMHKFFLKEIESRAGSNVDEVQTPKIHKPLIDKFNKKYIQG